jgi:hypothetical protein
MRIKIALKLRPFSHRPGIRCMVPYSTWEAQIFPAKILFHDLLKGGREELSIPWQGPVRGFTVLQDMERGRIEVFGKAQNGYSRYFITADGLDFSNKKIPLPFIRKADLPPSLKRLSLGIHKKQDWDLIERRLEMEEVFPFWIRLAQIIPESPLVPIGTAVLLKQNKLELAFQAAFQGILCPSLHDENYLGLIPESKIDPGLSPIGIIHEGARQIEALFFKEEDETVHLLPKLPKELHAGRFINLTTSSGDLIDIEWSKKQLKKVIVRPSANHSMRLKLQSQIHSFRLRTNARQKGQLFKHDQPLELQEGQTLYLDRFMH